MIDSLPALLLAIGIIQKPPCSPEKMQEILEQPLVIDPEDTATWEKKTVSINCSVKLEPGQVISKAVRFTGPAASNLTFDCNGATIEPLGKLRADTQALVVSSSRRAVDGQYVHEPVKNLTVKNCHIKGWNRVGSYLQQTGDPDSIAYKNQRGPDYVAEIRAVAPTDILFDNVTIENKHRVSLYISQGVTNFTLKNSRIAHKDAHGPSIYLDAESAFNTIDNNEFHHSSSNDREVLAIDGSEHNVISRNWFSGLGDGGIFAYRNCGELGELRYTGARNNEIRDNIFYYQNPFLPRPAVWVGSREGDRSFCTDDDAVPYQWDISHVDPQLGWDADWQASNTDDGDFARYNTVSGNRICNIDVSGQIRVRESAFNTPDYVFDNSTISCGSSNPIPR